MSRLTRRALLSGPVVVIAIIALFVAGIVATTQLQQDLLPNISLPGFIVVTPDPGVAPSVLDSTVTVPLTTAIQGVANESSIQSESASGASLIYVQFTTGTNLASTQQAVQTAISSVASSLPSTAKASEVETFSTNSLPILEYAVSSNQSLGDLSANLTQHALPTLQSVSGVSSVNVTGAPTEQVLVTLNPAKAALHGISLATVESTIQSSALTQSVGTVLGNDTAIPVYVSSSFSSISQIEQLRLVTGGSSSSQSASSGPPARYPGGSTSVAATSPSATASSTTSTVTIGDVATVTLTAVPPATVTRTNGAFSIGFSILETPSSNTVVVANAVKKDIPSIESAMGNGTKISLIVDDATPITSAINGIFREGLLGALFAVLVIFAFLRSLRATLVVAISIPLSLLVALLLLWSQGITLNILTVGALMVAIGRVVDDAIVVLENTSRHVQEGDEPVVAAYSAAREIAPAVTASTLTTVAVFAPIAFMSGIAGEFFSPFALTVVAALLTSLIVAFTVVPLLASRFLKKPSQVTPDAAMGPLQRAYIPIIRWATSHRALTLVLAAVFFFASMGLTPLLQINLLDQTQSPYFSVSVQMPKLSTLSQTNAQVTAIDGLIAGAPGVSGYQSTAGGNTDPFAPPGTVPPDPTVASITVLVANNSYTTAYSSVKTRLGEYHGAATVNEIQGQSSQTSSATQYQLQISGNSTPSLTQGANTVETALSHISGLSDVTSNLAAVSPEIVLSPRPALATSGVTIGEITAIVSSDISGGTAGTVMLPAGLAAIHVGYPVSFSGTPAALNTLPIPTQNGITPLAQLVSVTESPGPSTILRYNNTRTVTISATITATSTSSVERNVAKAIKTLALPSGVSTSSAGVVQELNTLLVQFALALLAAIALVYTIMVATFRSFLTPLILLVAIPFAATGAIIGLVVTGTPLSLPGMIGILMLAGIVVTNAIVLLDLVEQYREGGASVQDALINGGRRRLRPILMTALATMLALVPLALSGNGGGGFISAPLAVVVIGGLFTSTVLTLIIVPVLYSLLSRYIRTEQRGAMAAALATVAASGPARMQRLTPVAGTTSPQKATGSSTDHPMHHHPHIPSTLLDPETDSTTHKEEK